MRKTYIFGDLQGCFDSLLELLAKIGVTTDDRLWFVGDLVNRGPKSLEVLRFIKSEQHRCETVLGNHDVHLLRRHYLGSEPKNGDTLEGVLRADDASALVNWLAMQPFLIIKEGVILVHAGLHPSWCEDQIKEHAKGLNGLYGTLQGRTAFLPKSKIPKAVSTMISVRALDQVGQQVDFKGRLEEMPPGAAPWFKFPRQETLSAKIVFGHWSALGWYRDNKVICLDSGCVWGGDLTAYCIEEDRSYAVRSQEVKNRQKSFKPVAFD